LRAYVFAYAHGNVRTKSDGTKDQLIVVTVGNSGQTPAFDLVIHSNAKTFNPGQTLDFNLEKKKFTSKASLAGGGQAQNELPMGPLNPAQTLYVFGEVTYRDVFNIKRSTKFRFAIGGDYGTPDDGNLLVCNDGNEVD
jgi:hypothetical protein